jgi:large subunit ribosomal protein L7/L12
MAEETKKEEKKEAAPAKEEKKSEKAETALSKKVQTIVDAVKELSLIEVSELVKALEDEFGVSAAAPAMVAGPAAGAAGAEAAEEKTEFDVVLKDGGSNKIQAIKAVRQLKSDLGLSDAKKFVEDAPQTVLEAANKEDAEAAKKVLEEAGCTVELK